MKKILTILTLSLISLLLVGNVRAYNIYKSYKIGDQIQVAGENYYVIADSDNRLDYVTLLKEEPLFYSEIKPLMDSTEIASQIEKDNQDNTGYLKMAYLYTDTCVSVGNKTGCTTDYNLSSIKQVVDVWANNKFKNNELEEVNRYKARLITFEELRDNLGYSYSNTATSVIMKNEHVPSWVYNSQYDYWTMSPIDDSSYYTVWYVDEAGLGYKTIMYTHDINQFALPYTMMIRPVINLAKEVESVVDDKGENNLQDKNNNNNPIVKVADTLLYKPIVTVIIGLVVIGIGITTYIVILKRKK